MSHHNIIFALLLVAITAAMEALAPQVPRTMLQAARIVQVCLGVLAIYFFAAAVLGGRPF